jgi:hypothetical protein
VYEFVSRALMSEQEGTGAAADPRHVGRVSRRLQHVSNDVAAQLNAGSAADVRPLALRERLALFYRAVDPDKLTHAHIRAVVKYYHDEPVALEEALRAEYGSGLGGNFGAGCPVPSLQAPPGPQAPQQARESAVPRFAKGSLPDLYVSSIAKEEAARAGLVRRQELLEYRSMRAGGSKRRPGGVAGLAMGVAAHASGGLKSLLKIGGKSSRSSPKKGAAGVEPAAGAGGEGAGADVWANPAAAVGALDESADAEDEDDALTFEDVDDEIERELERLEEAEAEAERKRAIVDVGALRGQVKDLRPPPRSIVTCI